MEKKGDQAGICNGNTSEGTIISYEKRFIDDDVRK